MLILAHRYNAINMIIKYQWNICMECIKSKKSIYASICEVFQCQRCNMEICTNLYWWNSWNAEKTIILWSKYLKDLISWPKTPIMIEVIF